MVVLAVVAAFIAAILLIPIKIFADWHGSFRLWIKVMFLRFDVLPKKKKTPEPPPEKPSPPVTPPKQPAPQPERPLKTPTKTEPKPEKPKDESQIKKNKGSEPSADTQKAAEPSGFVDKFLGYYDMASKLFDPFRRALRKLIKIEELNVSVRVGTQDAANTAIYTGMLWGAVGGMLGLVTRFMTVEKQDIAVTPAYNETVLAAAGGCIIRTNPANIIGAVAIAAIAWLRYKCKIKKQNGRNKK